jgi:hypothetical protein
LATNEGGSIVLAAKNLKIKGAQLIGIHKLIPSVYGGPATTHQDDVGVQGSSKWAAAGCQSVATHDVHYSGRSLTDSESVRLKIDSSGCVGCDFANPSQKVGVLAYFTAASAIGRPSHSKALIYDDKLYYCMSHSDLYGSSADRTPKSVLKGRLVHFLRLETDQTIVDLVFSKIDVAGFGK